MVDKKRAMIHLHKQILTVVVQQIPGHARPLCHPIQPHASRSFAPINVIVLDDRIQRTQ